MKFCPLTYITHTIILAFILCHLNMLCQPHAQAYEFSLYFLESVLLKQLRIIALFGFHE